MLEFVDVPTQSVSGLGNMVRTRTINVLRVCSIAQLWWNANISPKRGCKFRSNCTVSNAEVLTFEY
jgi:hypothetical protein